VPLDHFDSDGDAFVADAADNDSEADDADDFDLADADTSIKVQYIAYLVCSVLDFYENLGGTNQNFLDLLYFKGHPDELQDAVRQALLMSLPDGFQHVIEEFVFELPSIEEWCAQRGVPYPEDFSALIDD
jgi:hypothetical protein